MWFHFNISTFFTWTSYCQHRVCYHRQRTANLTLWSQASRLILHSNCYLPQIFIQPQAPLSIAIFFTINGFLEKTLVTKISISNICLKMEKFLGNLWVTFGNMELCHWYWPHYIVNWVTTFRNDIQVLLILTQKLFHPEFMGPTWGPPGSCRPQMGPIGGVSGICHDDYHRITSVLFICEYIDGLMQDCSNSSTLAMELLQSCTKPSIWCCINDMYTVYSSITNSCNVLWKQLREQQLLSLSPSDIMQHQIGSDKSFLPVWHQAIA